jgi:hypothetical protein
MPHPKDYQLTQRRACSSSSALILWNERLASCFPAERLRFTLKYGGSAGRPLCKVLLARPADVTIPVFL